MIVIRLFLIDSSLVTYFRKFRLTESHMYTHCICCHFQISILFHLMGFNLYVKHWIALHLNLKIQSQWSKFFFSPMLKISGIKHTFVCIVEEIWFLKREWLKRVEGDTLIFISQKQIPKLKSCIFEKLHVCFKLVGFGVPYCVFTSNLAVFLLLNTLSKFQIFMY